MVKKTHDNTMNTSAVENYKEERKGVNSKGHLIGNSAAEGHFHRLF